MLKCPVKEFSPRTEFCLKMHIFKQSGNIIWMGQYFCMKLILYTCSVQVKEKRSTFRSWGRQCLGVYSRLLQCVSGTKKQTTSYVSLIHQLWRAFTFWKETQRSWELKPWPSIINGNLITETQFNYKHNQTPSREIASVIGKQTGLQYDWSDTPNAIKMSRNIPWKLCLNG